MFDKGYYRGPQLISSCILVGSCFIIPECHQFWQFFLVQGVLVGVCHRTLNPELSLTLLLQFACGCIAMPTLSAVTHWCTFSHRSTKNDELTMHAVKKRRSLAFGITAVGSSLGGSAYPILIRTLEKRVGYVNRLLHWSILTFRRFAWAMRIVGLTILVLLAISSLVSYSVFAHAQLTPCQVRPPPAPAIYGARPPPQH